jgi:hypothetical protein
VNGDFTANFEAGGSRHSTFSGEFEVAATVTVPLIKLQSCQKDEVVFEGQSLIDSHHQHKTWKAKTFLLQLKAQ